MHKFTNKFQGNELWFFKSDTTFPHIQFGFTMFGVFICKPLKKLRVTVNAHVIQSDKVFLRGNARK
jgi:hypothetical protein